MIRTLVAVSLVASALVGWAFGRHSVHTVAALELRNIQARLAFSRIQDDRRVAAMLERACLQQAIAEVDFSTEQEMLLLSHYLQEGLSDETQTYIRASDPTLFNDLKDFRSKYGSVREKQPCSGSSSSS